MSSLTTGNAEQYSDSQKLAARARLASKYAISEQPWFPWVAGHLPLKTGDRILDAGCGPGWFWEAVAEAIPARIDVTLTDLSPGMVEEAQMRCAPLPLSLVDSQVADAAALPFEAGTFDGVLAMHMLYHMPDPAVAISEMFRVLKPGGFIAVTTNGMNNTRGLYELTTVFGGTPYDPAAAAFGFDEAERQLREQFGNVAGHRNITPMRVTSVEDVFLGLTSFPPGDRADEAQLAAFRAAIDEAFAKGDGALHVTKEAGLFLAIKAKMSGGFNDRSCAERPNAMA